MERDYTCVKYGGIFSVKDAAPVEHPMVPEGSVNVLCPFCERSNPITWPQDGKFIVVPK
jgi:hypothetical protein